MRLRKLVAVLAGVLGLTGLGSEAVAGTPDIELSAMEWNFGEIWYGAVEEFPLVISNVGDDVLKLQTVRASCGCTTSKPAKNVLQPGESTTATVKFDSRKKSGGDIHTTVTIVSNDPDERKLTFHLRGKVRRVLSVDPMGGVVLRSGDGSKPLEGVARITNLESEPMDLRIKSVNAARFEIELKTIEEGRIYEMVGRSKGPLDVGRTTGYAVLTTGLEREPEVNVHVTAVIVDRVNLVPAAIYLNPQIMLEKSNRTVMLHYYGDNPDFEIREVKANHESVKVQFSPARPPSAGLQRLQPAPRAVAQVRVDCPPGRELPPEGVKVTIVTNEPGYEEQVVLVTPDPAAFRAIMYKTNR